MHFRNSAAEATNSAKPTIISGQFMSPAKPTAMQTNATRNNKIAFAWVELAPILHLTSVICLSRAALKRPFAPFIVTDPDRFRDIGYKDLAVTDFSGSGCGS